MENVDVERGGGEAGCHESLSLTLQVDAFPWADIPRGSAGEVAWALRRAGYEARLGGPDYIALYRGSVEAAWIPLHEGLHPAMLKAILRTIDVTPEELAGYLAQDFAAAGA